METKRLVIQAKLSLPERELAGYWLFEEHERDVCLARFLESLFRGNSLKVLGAQLGEKEEANDQVGGSL